MEYADQPVATWRTRLMVYFVLLAAILFGCRHTLDAPPYQDQSVGWQEANFLVETNFDYYRLRYIEKHWTEREQGCRNYMTSILPTVWALLMKYSPSVRASLIAAHVLNIALSCLALLMVVVLSQPLIGWVGALLLAALVAATPLYHSQTEMVGMDIPMTAFGMVALACAIRHRFYWGAFFGLLAFLMKPTGSLVTVATLIYLGLLILGRSFRKDERASQLFPAVGANLFVFGTQVAVVLWGQSKHWSMHDSPSLATLSFELVPWLCPDLLSLFVASLIVSGGYLVSRMFQRNASAERAFAKGSASTVLLMGWMVQVLVLLAVTRVLFIPRYLILAVPCLYLTLGVAIGSLRSIRHLGFIAGTFLLLFHLANTEGRYFPSLDSPGATFVRNVPDADSRSNAFLERSCEYRPELASALRACQVLERKAGDRPIFAGNPFTRYLTLPRLGYVQSALQVYNSNYFDDAIRQFLCLAERKEEKPLFVWAGMARANLPPPAAEDQVLYKDDFQDPLIVYEKSIPSHLSRAELATWFLDETRTGAWPITRLELRLPYLCEIGALDQATAEYETILDANPQAASDPRIAWFPAEAVVTQSIGDLLPVARSAADQGLVSALARLMSYRLPVATPPTSVPQIGESPPRLDGCLTTLEKTSRLLGQGQITEGTRRLRELSGSASEAGKAAREALAFLHSLQGKEVEDEIGTEYLRALAEIQEGRYQAAIERLETEERAEDPAALILLGIAQAKLADWDASVERFMQALKQRPQDRELRRMLHVATERAGRS